MVARVSVKRVKAAKPSDFFASRVGSKVEQNAAFVALPAVNRVNNVGYKREDDAFDGVAKVRRMAVVDGFV